MKQCIVCGTTEEFAFDKLGFDIVRCPKCRLFRTILLSKSPQKVNQYYSKSYFTGSPTRAGYANYDQDHSIVRRNSHGYLRLINKFLHKGKILDVGCATGIFLQEAEKVGFNGFGIDVSKYAISKAESRLSNKVKLSSLRSGLFKKGSFNILTFFDVFEHLYNPRQTLQIAHNLLKKNGLVFINTGDTGSALAKLQGRNWHFFIPPQHIYYFSKQNLIDLLESEGFATVYSTSQGKWLSLRYLLQLARTIDNSKLANWAYGMINHRSLGRLPLHINLRDNMTIIARKR